MFKCKHCKKQPQYFNEVIVWATNRIEPDGNLIDVKDSATEGVYCPNCDNLAEFQT